MPVSYEWLEGENLKKNKHNLFKLMEDRIINLPLLPLAQSVLAAERSEARRLHPGRRLLYIYTFILIAYIL